MWQTSLVLSVYMTISVSVERYISVVYPLLSLRLYSTHSYLCLALPSVAFSVIFTLPNYFLLSSEVLSRITSKCFPFKTSASKPTVWPVVVSLVILTQYLSVVQPKPRVRGEQEGLAVDLLSLLGENTSQQTVQPAFVWAEWRRSDRSSFRS